MKSVFNQGSTNVFEVAKQESRMGLSLSSATPVVPTTTKVGITERGDAGLDLSWEQKLDSVAFAVLITKNVARKEFREAVLRNKDRVIIHATCTTYGGTKLEPNVITVDEYLNGIRWLLYEGFPADQIVIRLDPIIPTDKGLARVKQFLDMLMHEAQYVAQPTQGSFKYPYRIKYSFIDMYRHVVERFASIGYPNPYGGSNFAPSASMVQKALNLLAQYPFQYTSCAENTPHKGACISEQDAKLMGMDKDYLVDSAKQRKGCLCPANKTELLTQPKRCPHQCLYCYWK